MDGFWIVQFHGVQGFGAGVITLIRGKVFGGDSFFLFITFQDAGWANGGSMSDFRYTLINSKLEANQTEAGTFSFAGTTDQAGAALKNAQFQYESIGENFGQDEYRSRGNWFAGGNSAHFNVDQIDINPWARVPQAQGSMHFGEHNPFADSPSGLIAHCILDGAC